MANVVVDSIKATRSKLVKVVNQDGSRHIGTFDDKNKEQFTGADGSSVDSFIESTLKGKNVEMEIAREHCTITKLDRSEKRQFDDCMAKLERATEIVNDYVLYLAYENIEEN